MAQNDSDFMITEYERISTAYFGLQNQVNDWFKTYLTIIGFPLTIFTAVLRLVPSDGEVKLTTLPVLVAGLLALVSLLGFFITISIVSMRMEMLMYARTINLIRRYFALKTEGLEKYLVLPKTDTKPGFYETKDSLNWQIGIIAIIDGVLLGIAFINLTAFGLCFSILISGGYSAFHLIFYRILANRRSKKWNIIHPDDLGTSNY